jgi:hypothetical protein
MDRFPHRLGRPPVEAVNWAGNISNRPGRVDACGESARGASRYQKWAPHGPHRFPQGNQPDRRNEVSPAWGLLLLSGFYPLYRAWRGAAGTTLRWSIAWAALAWAAWCAAVSADSPALRYLALCLTGCAGIAVLGARRPGVKAWNFVVAGLLLAFCRPFLEGLGELRLETGHLIFLGVILAVGLGNFLPTRQAFAVLVLGTWCGLQLAGIEAPGLAGLVALAPWLGLLSAGRWANEEDFDAIWRSFRDRYGFVWAQRLRDQFNRSAENAGWAVTLGWGGLCSIKEGIQPSPEDVRSTLRALLKRFRSEGDA